MDLRHLRAFLAVADELHFTRAATRLGMAQPPLSQLIKALEEELRIKLFRRSARGVELTQAGSVFRQHAQIAVNAAAEAILAARRTSTGEEGAITIGYTNSSSFNPRVTSSIVKFRHHYPRVHVELVEHPTVRLIAALEARQIDAAFLRPAPGDESRLELTSLPPERLRLVLPAGHALAGHPTVDLGDLAGSPFIMFPRANGPLLYDALILACTRNGFSPIIVQEAPQLSSAITLVAAGIGITLIPESMCQLHAYGVTHAAVSDPEAIVPLALARLKGATDEPIAINFLEHVASECETTSRYL